MMDYLALLIPTGVLVLPYVQRMATALEDASDYCFIYDRGGVLFGIDGGN